MDGFDVWFRWIIGGLIALFGALSTWLLLRVHDLDKAVAVLQARPHVNPIDYATSMANVTNAITAVSTRLMENQQTRDQQFAELRRENAELRQLLQELREELLISPPVRGR